MEYIPGEDLSEMMIQNGKPFTVANVEKPNQKTEAKTVVKNSGAVKTPASTPSQKAKRGGDGDDETISLNGMKITENGVETPDAIIDENGVRLKHPPKPPRSPGRKSRSKPTVDNRQTDSEDN